MSTRRTCAVLLLTIGLGSCSLGRSVGQEIGTGLEGQEDDLVALERRLADSIAVFLGDRVRDRVLDQADSTVADIVANARLGADSVVGDVVESLDGRLRDASEAYLRANLAVIDSAGDEIARRLAASLVDELAYRVRTQLTPSVDSMGHAVATGLRTGIERELQPAVGALLREIEAELRRELLVTVRAGEQGLLGDPKVRDIIMLVLLTGGGALTAAFLHERRARRRLEDEYRRGISGHRTADSGHSTR